METFNSIVNQLETEDIDLGVDTPRNFTQCHRQLYINLLLTEKYLRLNEFSNAQERIYKCYDLHRTLKCIGSEYENSRESSYDILKIMQLENRIKDGDCERGLHTYLSSKARLREEIENSIGDAELKREIIEFEIKNLLKTSSEDHPFDVTNILSLFYLLPPHESRDILQIELFAKNIHNNLPELSHLTQSQVMAVVSICGEAGLERRGECLQCVLSSSWSMTQAEKEECLASMLLVSGTDLLDVSRYVASGYQRSIN